MVEGTSLLRKHTGLNLYRGFESLALRHHPHFWGFFLARANLVVAGPYLTINFYNLRLSVLTILFFRKNHYPIVRHSGIKNSMLINCLLSSQ